ncbi:unnamed protein product, partial [Mesorhabditis belari]|uniref:Uncharacterized protein n=1 Tax=Mesorhabditis belari TaxID=2138241 RepID=A0AAF3FNW9_9BILA
MASGLTCIGHFWTMLSLIATALIIGSVLSPEWLIGQVVVENRHMPAYFGIYKRCNYPIFDKQARKVLLIAECGIYESFAAMPSLYWQLSAVASFAGAALSLMLVFLLLPSMCLRDVITHGTAPIVGFFQIVAAILLSIAGVLYPFGWDNRQVRDACGEKADRFNPGGCQIGKALVSMCVGAALLVICCLLSLCGGKRRKRRGSEMVRQDEVIRGYEQPMSSTKA